jgi:hypothetical protein
MSFRGFPQSTHTCLWRFSGPLTGVLCKWPFAEFVAKSEFGDSGHRRTPTGNVSKIALTGCFQKARRCGIDPFRPFKHAESGHSDVSMPSACRQRPSSPACHRSLSYGNRWSHIEACNVGCRDFELHDLDHVRPDLLKQFASQVFTVRTRLGSQRLHHDLADNDPADVLHCSIRHD